jgi:site-specific DNA recombinase
MSEARAYIGQPSVIRVKTVRVIPPTIQPLSDIPAFSSRPRRVAAYARVSTNSEEQLTSYEAQVKHYTEYIKSKETSDNWQFVDVYTDKGITGTSTKKREGFNRMIQDALAGKIDLIITKSVSRFARNTVDTLTAIRKLKEYGVEVYFEEQNIYTMDGKGEVLLTIMSSIAQEESRNISENVTWGIRKRFADGKVMMPYGQFMGYRRGKDGTPEVVEAEAAIVRTIFRRFLEGATPAIIARELNLASVPCPSRKSLLGEDEIEAAKARKKTARWSPSTVESILANEKYKGDAILQKTYCTDYINKTFVENDGSEIPKYYAQNSHPAIVSAEVFDLAQMEMEWRRSLKGSYSGKSCFASRVVCGDCGAFYGSKVWHSTDEYRRTIWRCNNKYEGDEKCSTPHVTQDELENAFVSVMQRVIHEKGAIFAVCREALDEVLDTAELDQTATRLQDQALGMAERVRALIDENARVRRNQEEYRREYDALAAEHEKLSEKIRAIEEQKKDKAERGKRIELFLRMLEQQKECVRFEPYTFVALVDKVVVQRGRRMEFCFKNGMKCAYPQ